MRELDLFCYSCRHRWSIQIADDCCWQDYWKYKCMVPEGMEWQAAYGRFCETGVHSNRWFKDGEKRFCKNCEYDKIICPKCGGTSVIISTDANHFYVHCDEIISNPIEFKVDSNYDFSKSGWDYNAPKRKIETVDIIFDNGQERNFFIDNGFDYVNGKLAIKNKDGGVEYLINLSRVLYLRFRSDEI